MIKVNLLHNKKEQNGVKGPVVLAFALMGLAMASGSMDFRAIAEQSPQKNIVHLEELLIQRMSYHEARTHAINDGDQRIHKDFQISDSMKDRVGFWFDIYAKYDQNQRVIHHTQYPWIVFKVVDVSEIINADKPKARWMRNQKADELVKKEVDAIRAALKRIAATGKANLENEYEKIVADSLEKMDGSLKQKARNSTRFVRSQTGQKNHFIKALEISPLYLSGMEEIFEQNKLPTELTRLPFVESSFNKHAVSRVGASGIWQFMNSTGKSFMTVNKYIDERKSPFKATQAAAKLLKENHMILRKSWPLAVTAWNHGPPGVRRSVKRTKTTDIGKILAHPAKTFDFASSNFYAEFLAALHVEKYQKELFEGLTPEEALDLHAVRLARATRTQDLLKRSGLTKDDFLFFNPDLRNALRHNARIPRGFTIMVDNPARVSLSSMLTKDTQAPIEKSIVEISKN